MQLFVFGLFVFHTWLAATNTTTYEVATGGQRLWYLAGRVIAWIALAAYLQCHFAGTEPRECDLPYSRGLGRNLRLFFCTLERPGPWVRTAAGKVAWQRIAGPTHHNRALCSPQSGRGAMATSYMGVPGQAREGFWGCSPSRLGKPILELLLTC
jgi:hypothetical protein